MLDYALKIAQSGTIALIPAASSGFRARLRRVVVRKGLGSIWWITGLGS
jgi:hypothetical protein